MRPAVSTSTTSKPWFRAGKTGRQHEQEEAQGPQDSPSCSQLPPTVRDGLHGDPCRVLPIALLIELHHGPPAVALRGVQGIEAAGVRAELLHCSRTEGVTRGDEDAETILDEPERDLQPATEKPC